MASIRPLPFTVEAKSAEGGALFRVKNRPWPMFCRPRKPLRFCCFEGPRQPKDW